MSNHRILWVAVALTFASSVGCDAGGADVQDEEIISEPATERVEIRVPSQDTMIIRTDSVVDTMEVRTTDPFD